MSHDCCQGNKHSEAPKKVAGDSGEMVYTCPMHPEIEKSAPGMCPECGMSLVAKTKKATKQVTKKSLGKGVHGKHAGHSTNVFLKKFWIALTLTVPLVLYSDLVELFVGLEMPRFFGYEYVILLLGTAVFFYGGWVFLAGSYREIRGHMPGMMTLIALAIVAAYTWSVYATFTADMTLFWELGTLITIMLLGHWLEMRSVKKARGALKELSALLPDTVEVERNGKIETISVAELKSGDVVHLKPGGRVPTDGEVVEGVSEIDESIATGESKPVAKKEGDEVIAGTINADGFLKIKVTNVGEETFLANVMRLVAEAESSKSRLQLLSDKAAFVLTLVAVSVGAITFVAWLSLGGEVSFAVARLVAVLVIACPHALGLAVPLVASISTGMAAENGFVVKSRLALESARSVDTVLFDKTGTLTHGEFWLDEVFPANGFDTADVLKFAGSVNKGSEHAIAKAVVEGVREQGVEIVAVTGFERVPGKGAKGTVDGAKVLIGSEALLDEAGFEIPEDITSSIDEEAKKGKTVVHAVVNGKYAGALSLSDKVRTESKEAVEMLHKEGIRVAMVTGDSEETAAWVSSKLGIDEYFARVLPEEKIEKVRALQARGERVAMVGDGVNDAPALAQADLGIAIGAGTNVAIESAGIVLVRNDLRDIGKIIRLSRLTWRKMIQNLFWATGYNIVALPLAAGALVTFGVPAIDPAVGAIFMSASTVIVAFNAVLMRRVKL
ncbi:MAG: heavy metal translocating P-type ATPase [Candidatus Paceibacterota bacterium]